MTEINWESPEVADADQWPVGALNKFNDELPSVVCKAWRDVVIYGSHTAPRYCHYELFGDTLSELHTSVVAHITSCSHVESPLADVNQHTTEALQRRKKAQP